MAIVNVSRKPAASFVTEFAILLSDQFPPRSGFGTRTAGQITNGRVKSGKNWITQILKRHPSLKLRGATNLNTKRGKIFDETTVQDHHFSLLHVALNGTDIPWENMWRT